MEYNHILKFLEKFKKILFKKEEIYNIIIETIFKNTSIRIEINKIKIENTTIFVQVSPIILSEILINKDKILLDLKELIPNYKITNIK